MSTPYVEGVQSSATHTLYTIYAQDDGAGASSRPSTPMIAEAVTRFTTYLSSGTWESFETTLDDTPANLTTPLDFVQANGITVRHTNTTGSYGFTNILASSSDASAGRWAYTGTSYLSTASVNPDYARIIFTPATVRAFAVVLSDLGDLDSNKTTVRFTFSDASTLDWLLPHGAGEDSAAPYNGQGIFFGVRSSANIAEISFHSSVAGTIDQFGYDYYVAEISANVTVLPSDPLGGRNVIPPIVNTRRRRRNMRRGCR